MTVQASLRSLLLQHEQHGRLAEAEGCYRQILAVVPHHVPALHHSLPSSSGRRRLDLAEQLLRQVIRLEPNNMTACCHLGIPSAWPVHSNPPSNKYEAALRLKPDYPEVLNNLGLALAARGRLPESRDALVRARELRPGMAEIHYEPGNSLRDLGT